MSALYHNLPRLHQRNAGAEQQPEHTLLNVTSLSLQ